MKRNNKDAVELAIAAAVFIGLMTAACKIGGNFGFTLLVLGAVIMGMFAYYEYRAEQALARERHKVKMLAAKIREAYEHKEDI